MTYYISHLWVISFLNGIKDCMVTDTDLYAYLLLKCVVTWYHCSYGWLITPLPPIITEDECTFRRSQTNPGYYYHF